MYDEGLRIYNDFDILINKADLKECQKLLKDNGFVQGYYLRQTKEIKVATRQDIIMSKLNYGQTVPFLKIENDLPICIDINFSLDYKANGQEDIVNSLLSNELK